MIHLWSTFEALTFVSLWRLEHHESESFLKCAGVKYVLTLLTEGSTMMHNVVNVLYHVGENDWSVGNSAGEARYRMARTLPSFGQADMHLHPEGLVVCKFIAEPSHWMMYNFKSGPNTAEKNAEDMPRIWMRIKSLSTGWFIKHATTSSDYCVGYSAGFQSGCCRRC